MSSRPAGTIKSNVRAIITWLLVLGLIALAALVIPHFRNIFGPKDVIRDLHVAYDVRPDGKMQVTWEADWDFGETGRRGIFHNVVTREIWDVDPSRDVMYAFDDIDVTSPTGAVDSFTTRMLAQIDQRARQIRIGSESRPLDESRHTYIISYTLTGALRTFDGVPQLYWDVNSADDVPIDKVTITVNAPEGVTEARCLVGENECESSVQDGVATYTATDVDEPLSVVANLPASSVRDAEPSLRPSVLTSVETLWTKVATWLGLFIVGVAALVVINSIATRNMKPPHQRWNGVPPGVIDRNASVTQEPMPTPPVQFHPPDYPLAEAGLALDATIRPQHLAATLVEMAMLGAITLKSDPLQVAPKDHKKCRSQLHDDLYARVQDPQSDGKLDDAMVTRMLGVIRDAVQHEPDGTTEKDYTRLKEKPPLNAVVNFRKAWNPPSAWLLLVELAALIWLGMAVHGLTANTGITVLAVFAGIAAIGLGDSLGRLVAPKRKGPSGPLFSRTPLGSAVAAQTEGFRTYLSTVEAKQLDQEADQDIFSRYLPWAVMFDLTERWVQVCSELAERKAIPPLDFTAVGGATTAAELSTTYSSLLNTSAAGLTSAGGTFAAVGISPSSGGSGGSSGFSGGSSGGGGGGGTSSGSW